MLFNGALNWPRQYINVGNKPCLGLVLGTGASHGEVQPGTNSFLKLVGGETTKAVAFRAFWEAGAPLVGDEGGQGWAAWEASQGVTLQTPTNTGAVPSHAGMATDEDANARQEKEEKGGWGQWVPLMPETPQELKTAPVAEGGEAVAVADEVSSSSA